MLVFIGKAGGACTSAFLEAVYQGFNSAGSFTWAELLRRMRNELQSKGFSQLPQLTSSRMINIHETMQVVPPQSPGFRRAVLIGINYVGQQGARVLSAVRFLNYKLSNFMKSGGELSCLLLALQPSSQVATMTLSKLPALNDLSP